MYKDPMKEWRAFLKDERNKLEKRKLNEAYYGSIPGEPETPPGYGGAVDAAKVQQHLSDEIDDLVRLGKLDINDLSVETVRANQEIPWDKFQAIDDEVLGDIIRDYQRRRKFYREGFFKKKEAPKHMTTADQLEKAVDIMTKSSECFQEGNGLNYVIWGMNDEPFDRELFQLGKQFTAKLKEVAQQYRSQEDGELTAQEDSLTEDFAPSAAEEAAKVNSDLGDEPGRPGSMPEDQTYWEERGISTGEDLAIMLISGTYSDMYKSVHGIRPRGAEFQSAQEAQEALESLDRYYEEMVAQEKIDAKAQEEYQRGQDELAALMPDEYEAQYNKMPKQSGMGRGQQEGRDWQKESDRITGHEDNKTRVLDKGGNKHQEPGWEEKRPKKRGKSSPPAALEELIYKAIKERFKKVTKEK